MEIQNYNVQILTASEGMFLTQKAEVLPEHESRLYVQQITVDAKTKDNYREATVEEKTAYEESLMNMQVEPEQKTMAMPIPELPQEELKEMPKEEPKVEPKVEQKEYPKRENKIDELRKELDRTLRRIEKQEKAGKKLMKAIVIGIGIIIVGIITLIII
jgi:tetrahydromethanopterin S-methyltransferase subunit G